MWPQVYRNSVKSHILKDGDDTASVWLLSLFLDSRELVVEVQGSKVDVGGLLL